MLAAQLAELPGDALALVLAQLPSARDVDRAASDEDVDAPRVIYRD